MKLTAAMHSAENTTDNFHLRRALL
jgi:hypothetical protein